MKSGPSPKFASQLPYSLYVPKDGFLKHCSKITVYIQFLSHNNSCVRSGKDLKEISAKQFVYFKWDKAECAAIIDAINISGSHSMK